MTAWLLLALMLAWFALGIGFGRAYPRPDATCGLDILDPAPPIPVDVPVSVQPPEDF